MDEIISSLQPWQKTQLHEVADGMLKIYRTLARMQFINEFDIAQGPHDMAELLPFCRGLNVDDSIIYLYSILPYVGGGGDFVGRGAMLDLRKERDIEEARNPMYDNDPLHPCMTALSSIANHDTALVYDARRHVLGMYTQDGDCTDRNLHERTPSVSGEEHVSGAQTQSTAGATEKRDTDDNEDDTQMTDIESQTEDGSETEQWQDEESDGENSSDGEIAWDRMKARPAPKVLRDIVRWYEQLIELPGDGEFSGTDWSPKITEPLYVEHGWPSADFDGEAFLVAKTRACAEASVRRNRRGTERVRDEVAELEKSLSEHKKDAESGGRVLRLNNILAKGPKNVEEEWDCRWQLHQIAETGKNLEQLLQAEKEKLENTTVVEVKPTETQLVLDNLKGEMEYNQFLVENVRTQIAGADDDEEMKEANRLRLPGLEKKARIKQRAYDTYQKDENVTPFVRPVYFDGTMDLREHLWTAITQRRTLPEAIELSRQFLETVPTEAKRAHMEAEHSYQSLVKALERSEEDAVKFKKQLLDKGYTGWPLEHCD